MTIARALNEAGFRSTGNRGANPFTKDTVRPFLMNRFYLGELPDGNGGWTKGRHAPLIDAELYEQTQDQRVRNRKGASQTPRRKSVYSLTGVTFCGHCAGRIHASKSGNGRRRVECYGRGQGKDCRQPSAYLDVYEAQIEEYLSEFHIPEDYQLRLLALQKQIIDTYDDVEGRRRKLTTRLDKLRKLFQWNDISEGEYLADRAAIQKELDSLQSPDDRSQVLERIAEFLRSTPVFWRAANEEERNQLVKQLFDKVWIKNKQVVAVKPRPELEPFFSLHADSDPELSNRIRKWRKRRDSNPRSQP